MVTLLEEQGVRRIPPCLRRMTSGLTCGGDTIAAIWQGAGHNAPSELLIIQAIMYCRTNMAQGLSCLNSDNNVYGRTTNPYNVSISHFPNSVNLSAVPRWKLIEQRDLGPGGSSGGEGALIAMRGSLLGVGSDLAGSIRVPVCATASSPLYAKRGVAATRRHRITAGAARASC